MKKLFERFINYLRSNEKTKTFSEYLVENLGTFFANVKALFSGVKLFEKVEILQQKLNDIEAQNNSDRSAILNELNRLKEDLNSNGRKSQEEIKSDIQKLGKTIAEELSILDDSMRMLLVSSILDNLEVKR